MAEPLTGGGAPIVRQLNMIIGETLAIAV